MNENNTDQKNPEKAPPIGARIPTHYESKPYGREKFRAAPSKTRKTLSSKARWPGIQKTDTDFFVRMF